MHFVRNVESFSIRDTIQDDVPSAEFDLIANNQIIPLPKNLFIFISPLLRKIFRSILPCFRPQVTIPDFPKVALELFTDIVTSAHRCFLTCYCSTGSTAPDRTGSDRLAHAQISQISRKLHYLLIQGT